MPRDLAAGAVNDGDMKRLTSIVAVTAVLFVAACGTPIVDESPAPVVESVEPLGDQLPEATPTDPEPTGSRIRPGAFPLPMTGFDPSESS